MIRTILLGFLLVALCHPYTLKSGDERIHFPVQLNLPKHDKSFQRFHQHKVEIVHCPEGFVFDRQKLICRVDLLTADLDYIQESCPSNFQGVVPDPFNCRNFINCHYGTAFLQTCSAHLLFSDRVKNCEWPEQSQCCEYMENQFPKRVGLSKIY